MWFNSRRSEKPHQGLTCSRTFFWKQREIRKDDYAGVAWPSSALGVSCRLKCHIERNSRPMLHIHWRQPLFIQGRKVRKTSGQHDPYALGYTHPTMANNNELQARKSKLISEISPQFRLGSETRPHEDGIGSNRGSACRGEYVLASCTHRPSSEQSWRRPKSPQGGKAEFSDEH